MSTRKPAAVSSESRVIHYFTRIIVVLVAVGAAVLSFDALTALAAASGVPTQLSWVWAVVIDGFILVSTLAAFALRERVGSAKYYAWSTLGVFVMFSILGNAWHAVIEKENFVLPIWVAVIVTGIPPLALFLAIHLLVLMVSPTPEQKQEYKRQQEHQERLNKLREKEIEKIEKAAIVKEIQEQAKTINPEYAGSPRQKVSTTPPPKPVVLRQVEKEEQTISTPTISKEIEQEPHIVEAPSTGMPVEAYSVNEILSESEVIALLDEKLEKGEKLPTGKQISDWMGKAERTGQKFLKNYKESKNLI